MLDLSVWITVLFVMDFYSDRYTSSNELVVDLVHPGAQLGGGAVPSAPLDVPHTEATPRARSVKTTLF